MAGADVLQPPCPFQLTGERLKVQYNILNNERLDEKYSALLETAFAIYTSYCTSVSKGYVSLRLLSLSFTLFLPLFPESIRSC